MQIGDRDLIGLIGPNGAGKTTVFNIITGVYTSPRRGRLSSRAANIGGLKPNKIARCGIARTFQNIRLFCSLSVFDNVRASFNLSVKHGISHALVASCPAFYREEADIDRQVMELLEIFDLGKAARMNSAPASRMVTKGVWKLFARFGD